MDILGLAKQFGITPDQVGEIAKMALSNESTKEVVAKVASKFGMEEKQAARRNAQQFQTAVLM